jgi:PAS domain S-box-containing protein
VASDLPRELALALRRLSVDLPAALAEVPIPTYVLNPQGEIRWMNAAAVEAFGDRRGEHYSSVAAPETESVVREQFARKIRGDVRATSYEAVLIGRDGRRFVADIDSVRLEDQGVLMGTFGIVEVVRPLDEEAAKAVGLTPRQLEVLQLLAGGCSTDRIASRLHVSRETARNHIKSVLRALHAHSRLEAVARARTLGIV